MFWQRAGSAPLAPEQAQAPVVGASYPGPGQQKGGAATLKPPEITVETTAIRSQKCNCCLSPAASKSSLGMVEVPATERCAPMGRARAAPWSGVLGHGEPRLIKQFSQVHSRECCNWIWVQRDPNAPVWKTKQPSGETALPSPLFFPCLFQPLRLQ